MEPERSEYPSESDKVISPFAQRGETGTGTAPYDAAGRLASAVLKTDSTDAPGGEASVWRLSEDRVIHLYSDFV